MRSRFVGHHILTEEQFQDLWHQGTFVIDANVLLDIYRLPASARTDLIKVLDSIKDRIWIPFHVALEFQQNRIGVMAESRKLFDGAVSTINSSVKNILSALESLELGDRGVVLDTATTTLALSQAKDAMLLAISDARLELDKFQSEDPLRSVLDEIIGGKIGEPPANQAELDALISDGDDRYAEKIPPGFKDGPKKEDSYFRHNGINYLNRFGDLILWRQLLAGARSGGFKKIIFVTRDAKEDWWWIESGRTLGPHPELVYEAMREAGVDLYWQYSPTSFLQFANKFLAQTVSEQTIEQVSEVSHKTLLQLTSNTAKILGHLINCAIGDAENAVRNWLIEKGLSPSTNQNGFPDFIVSHENYVFGIEVKSTSQYSPLPFQMLMETMSRGFVAVGEGRISEFVLVLALRENPGQEDPDPEEIQTQISGLLKLVPIRAVIVGLLLPDNTFSELVRVENRKADPDTLL